MFLFLENNIQHISLLEIGTGFVVQRKTWETVVYKLLVAQPSRKMRQKIVFLVCSSFNGLWLRFHEHDELDLLLFNT